MPNDIATIAAAAATVEARLALKRCPVCQRRLPHSAFRPTPARPDGLSSNCRDCHREHMRRYRATSAGRAASREAARKHYAKQRAERQAATPDVH